MVHAMHPTWFIQSIGGLRTEMHATSSTGYTNVGTPFAREKYLLPNLIAAFKVGSTMSAMQTPGDSAVKYWVNR